MRSEGLTFTNSNPAAATAVPIAQGFPDIKSQLCTSTAHSQSGKITQISGIRAGAISGL